MNVNVHLILAYANRLALFTDSITDGLQCMSSTK